MEESPVVAIRCVRSVCVCGMKSAYVERMCVNFVVTVCATWGDGVCVYERERERDGM